MLLTVIAVVRGLHQAYSHFENSDVWVYDATIGNEAPNSLFFFRDPVAIDSVMSDILDAEGLVSAEAYDHLIYAQSVGLGVYEQGDPWGSAYDEIDFIRCEPKFFLEIIENEPFNNHSYSCTN